MQPMHWYFITCYRVQTLPKNYEAYFPHKDEWGWIQALHTLIVPLPLSFELLLNPLPLTSTSSWLHFLKKIPSSFLTAKFHSMHPLLGKKMMAFLQLSLIMLSLQIPSLLIYYSDFASLSYAHAIFLVLELSRFNRA